MRLVSVTSSDSDLSYVYVAVPAVLIHTSLAGLDQNCLGGRTELLGIPWRSILWPRLRHHNRARSARGGGTGRAGCRWLRLWELGQAPSIKPRWSSGPLALHGAGMDGNGVSTPETCR